MGCSGGTHPKTPLDHWDLHHHLALHYLISNFAASCPPSPCPLLIGLGQREAQVSHELLQSHLTAQSILFFVTLLQILPYILKSSICACVCEAGNCADLDIHDRSALYQTSTSEAESIAGQMWAQQPSVFVRVDTFSMLSNLNELPC